MDFYTLSVIFLAIGAGALVKGATGMGIPLIAIPFIAATLGLQHAIVVTLVPVVLSNIWQIWLHREERLDPAMSFLTPMLIGCIVGVAGGVWFLTSAPEHALAITLGVLLIAYFIFRLARPSFAVNKDMGQNIAAPVGLAAGLLHGATGISAPIGVTFIHAMRFGRKGHLYAVSAMFLALTIAQFPSLGLAGLLKPDWVLQSLFAVIPMLLFMPIGQFLSSKLSPRAFDTMILAFLGIMGLKLISGL